MTYECASCGIHAVTNDTPSQGWFIHDEKIWYNICGHWYCEECVDE